VRDQESSEPQLARSSTAVKIRFGHGLGDCIYFAHVLELYARRGYRFQLDADPDKGFLFSALDSVDLVKSSDAAHVHWHDALRSGLQHGNDFLSANKIAINLSAPPLPNIGSAEMLWDELCGVKIDIKDHIPEEVHESIHKYLAELPRPLILGPSYIHACYLVLPKCPSYMQNE
jgi:hypothetical protein